MKSSIGTFVPKRRVRGKSITISATGIRSITHTESVLITLGANLPTDHLG